MYTQKELEVGKFRSKFAAVFTILTGFVSILSVSRAWYYLDAFSSVNTEVEDNQDSTSTQESHQSSLNTLVYALIILTPTVFAITTAFKKNPRKFGPILTIIVGYVVAFSTFIYGYSFSIVQLAKTSEYLHPTPTTPEVDAKIYGYSISGVLGGLGFLIATLTQIMVIEVGAMIRLINQESSKTTSNEISSFIQEYQLAKKSHKIWTFVAAIATGVGLYLIWKDLAEESEFPQVRFLVTVVFHYPALFYFLPNLLNLGSVCAKRSHYTSISLFLSTLATIGSFLIITVASVQSKPRSLAGGIAIACSMIVCFVIGIIEARRERNNIKISKSAAYQPLPMHVPFEHSSAAFQPFPIHVPFDYAHVPASAPSPASQEAYPGFYPSYVPQPQNGQQQIQMVQYPFVHFQNY